MLTFANIKAVLLKGKMALPSGFAGDRNNRTFGMKKSERSLAGNLVKPSMKLQKLWRGLP